MQIIRKQYFWARTLFSDMKATWKKDGLKGLYRKYGFKLFLGFFLYYLIRDSILYILLPWLIASQFMN